MRPPPSPIPLPCPLCGRSDAEELKRFPDGVRVGRCRGCRLIYTFARHPAPHAVLGPGDLDSLRTAYGPVLSGARAHYRRSNYRQYVRILSPYVPGWRLLDVGCAHGFFGREARAAGFEVTGVEPHPGMAEFARVENGLEVLTGMVETVDLGTANFDAATFTDSLEYLPDPVAALTKVAAALVRGGALFVKVPNAQYFLLRLALERRGVSLGGGEAFGPSLRVVHYTHRTLAAVVEKAGFVVVREGWPKPIHSPRVTRPEAWSELQPSWHERLPERLLRSFVYLVGRAEGMVTQGTNHGSPSLYVVGRRPS